MKSDTVSWDALMELHKDSDNLVVDVLTALLSGEPQIDDNDENNQE